MCVLKCHQNVGRFYYLLFHVIKRLELLWACDKRKPFSTGCLCIMRQLRELLDLSGAEYDTNQLGVAQLDFFTIIRFSFLQVERDKL